MKANMNSVSPLQTYPCAACIRLLRGTLLFSMHACISVPAWCVPLLLAGGKLHTGHAGIHELAGCRACPRLFQ